MSSPHALLMAKLEELDIYSHKLLLQFPRIEKARLAADIYRSMGDLMRLTVAGWKRYKKGATLGKLDEEVEVLRYYVRKAHGLRYISDNRYEIWSRHIDEIGRMVGGWIRGLKER